MFSIAAINDPDTRSQWEPLAPTKEAQEFHLSQTYHEGLLKLQSKDYEKARELLEAVLTDPLLSNIQVSNDASDAHLLQLRFLTLKNLATVFLEQGSVHHESALNCYLQAVEIDAKDSVVWNQLGTLSCSMGLLSIARWAFEQGLICSPNNWNCMAKLLEVLIAIGDEVSCLSVAELILRHWPSHSRALLVKQIIEESERAPFAPRGIDRLVPKHVRLQFVNEKKRTYEKIEEGVASKRLKQNIDVHLVKATWGSLADALLHILLPASGDNSEKGLGNICRSGDIRLNVHLPSCSGTLKRPVEINEHNDTLISENTRVRDCHPEKSNTAKVTEAAAPDEQPQERRSSRLERLRNRKPGKEEFVLSNGKNLASLVVRVLEPFVVGGIGVRDAVTASNSTPFQNGQANPVDIECNDVARFVRNSANNYGAYHMGHMLLEEAACKDLVCQDSLFKFLELEKLIRDWGKDRTPKCSLFLGELYQDFGLSSSDPSSRSDCMSEVSYHLCKIIESVALDYPFKMRGTSGSGTLSLTDNSQGGSKFSTTTLGCQDPLLDDLLLTNNCEFWIRFFWLSGRLSTFEGNKERAHEEFCISLSFLARKDNTNDGIFSVSLPHCKIIKELTFDRILYEINLLKVDFLMKEIVGEMMEKEMYMDCIRLVSPLLFPTTDAQLDMPPIPNGRGGWGESVELSALDVLIKACEKAKPMDIGLYLNCHRRKLQMLAFAAGMKGCDSLGKRLFTKAGKKVLFTSEIESKDNSSKNWDHMVGEEVKAICQCLSEVKNFLEQCDDLNGIAVPISIISDIQSLLLAVMSSITSIYLCKKYSGMPMNEENEYEEECCFINAAISFCKLQHLNPEVSVKTQVELIVAIHDLLAEYEICCASDGRAGEDGTFLKFAIKHLLCLDMKVKYNLPSSDKGATQIHEQFSSKSYCKSSLIEPKFDSRNKELCGIDRDTSALEMDVCQVSNFRSMPSNEGFREKGAPECGNIEDYGPGGKLEKYEIEDNRLTDHGNVVTREERGEHEFGIDNALDQCFFCLYGINLKPDSSYEDNPSTHKNTSRGDYQTKEQCADVFHYILPYAKASSRTELIKLRRVLRAIRKHFPQPPDDILSGNLIDNFLDDPNLCEEKLSEEAGSDGFLEMMVKVMFPGGGGIKQYKKSLAGSSDPYSEVYCDLYYYLALSEEMSATDKWPGFVLTKEGEEFVQQNADLFKYDLLYNPLRFESWQRLANIYDEEVDLLLNDGSKHINVTGWRKNDILSQRVERSRRRSRRCLLMSLALARTAVKQGEIHELLALVYYDSIQNVVPFYDQRTILPSKDSVWKSFCLNSMNHFKKAFSHKKDWSHALYMGIISEKLGYSHETSFSYYDEAIRLNPSAVDPFYRLHASRLKLLFNCGKQNMDALKVVSTYSFSQASKEAVLDILGKICSVLQVNINEESTEDNLQGDELKEVWNILYCDCLSALQICVEGDLKHFHKARYMLAQGLYRRGESSGLEKAKDELSFCFKSSRSSFTINMWEIDGMVKKGRRKAPGLAGNRKTLEVNLPESSRKFITCIRKYLLFYLKLLEEAGDIYTLDRLHVSLRADKRFSLCLEDLVPLALGRYVKALVSCIHHAETAGSGASSNSEHLLEKIFSLFIEQGAIWPDICKLPEMESPEWSESVIFRYLYQYIQLLETNLRLETLEAINEKIRKRFKNQKLWNTNCAKVFRHASVAWCRSLIISLALITPLQSAPSRAIPDLNLAASGLENSQLLCVSLQTDGFWVSSFEDALHLESLRAKWDMLLSKFKNVAVKKASEENLETANTLLRYSYNFFRDSSCVTLPSSVDLYLIQSQLVGDEQVKQGMEGMEVLDLSTQRKLLVWAHTLLHGRYASISSVVKHCEENVKSKTKKGFGSSMLASASVHATTGARREEMSHGEGGETEIAPLSSPPAAFSLERENWDCQAAPPSYAESRKTSFCAPLLQRCKNSDAEKSNRPRSEEDIRAEITEDIRAEIDIVKRIFSSN